MKDNILIGAGVWFASARFTRDITVAYIGVPLNVLVACAIGAFCSFSFSEKVDTRRSMFLLFTTCLLMGAAFTACVNFVLVRWMEVELTDGTQAGIGAVVSFITRFFLPWLADVVKHGKWLSWIPFFRRDKE
jgi:hypothetical protein